MSDPPVSRPKSAGTFENAGKWLALAGSLFAAGQAGTAWLRGYWQAESEKEKSTQELAIAQLKERSDLAQQYLKVILDKDTTPEGRATLLTALAQLDGHPLQKWAQQQYDAYQRNLTRLFDAYKAQEDAAQQQKNSSASQMAGIQADIEKLNSDIQLARDDPEQREKLHQQIVAKSAELGRVRATLSVAVVQVEETRTVITRSEKGLPVAPGQTVAEAITAISDKVTVETLMTVFPERARPNVQANVAFLQAALKEFRVSDPRLAAAIIATIAVETPTFEAYEESANQGRNYEGRPDLGNTQPGDGVRYRGRGYLGITGRMNYTQMSTRLGLGSRLVDFPEDAKSPEVASRIIVAWFVDRQDRLGPSLASGDLAPVRRVVAGGPTHLDQFTAAYNKVLAQLS